MFLHHQNYSMLLLPACAACSTLFRKDMAAGQIGMYNTYPHCVRESCPYRVSHYTRRESFVFLRLMTSGQLPNEQTQIHQCWRVTPTDVFHLLVLAVNLL